MATFTVSPEELEALASSFNSEAEALTDLIGRMQTLIDNMTEYWTGEASQAFADQFTALRPSFEKGVELIGEVSTQLTTSASNYREAEQAGFSAFSAFS